MFIKSRKINEIIKERDDEMVKKIDGNKQRKKDIYIDRQKVRIRERESE